MTELSEGVLFKMLGISSWGSMRHKCRLAALLYANHWIKGADCWKYIGVGRAAAALGRVADGLPYEDDLANDAEWHDMEGRL